MLPDVGLHQLPLDNGLSTTEANVHFNLLCACITYEGIWCLYLGRPTSISQNIIQSTLRECRKLDTSHIKMARAWVELCAIMSEVNEFLNDSTLSETQVHRKSANLESSLHLWAHQLPTTVVYDGGSMTNLDSTAYGLQMQYSKLVMLLHNHRAFPEPSRKRKRGTIGERSVDNFPETEASRGVIQQHAVRIAKLLLHYRQMFGTEKIPSITLDNALVAAMSLIRLDIEACNIMNVENARDKPTGVGIESRAWLQSIVDTLQALHQHFPITERMLRSMQQATLNTSLQNMFALIDTRSAASEPSASPENVSLAPNIAHGAEISRPPGSHTLHESLGVEAAMSSSEPLEPHHLRTPISGSLFLPLDLDGNGSVSAIGDDQLFDFNHEWPHDELSVAASAISWSGIDFMKSMLSPVN